MVLNTLIWLLGCQTQMRPKVANEPISIQVLAVQDNVLNRSSSPVPPGLMKTIKSELALSNIQTNVVAAPDAFQHVRQTEQRLKQMTAPLLMVETSAEFYSQLNGRFRWTVSCRLTLLAEDNTKLSREFTTPVFHQFHHEREAEAILAAEEVIRQQLRGLIEDYLRSQNQ